MRPTNENPLYKGMGSDEEEDGNRDNNSQQVSDEEGDLDMDSDDEDLGDDNEGDAGSEDGGDLEGSIDEEEIAQQQKSSKKQQKMKKKKFLAVKGASQTEDHMLGNRTQVMEKKKKGGFFSKLKVFKEKEEEELDEGGIEDLKNTAVVSGGVGTIFKRWRDYISVFQDMYDIEILAESCEKPFETVGISKGIKEKLSGFTSQTSVKISSLVPPIGRQSLLKHYSASMLRRQKKIVQFWKRGKKKNALRVASK